MKKSNSVQLKLNLDLDTQLGRTLFAGISGALSGSEVTVIQFADTDQPAKEETKLETVIDKPKRQRNTAASTPVVETGPGPEAPETETGVEEPVTDQPAETGTDAADNVVTLADIKAMIPKKVAKNRDAIKAKLTELGAENSDKLDKGHYPAFLEFLNKLS